LDGLTFDVLTRAVAGANTRRHLLRVLIGVPPAGWIASLDVATNTVARGRKPRRHHARHQNGRQKNRLSNDRRNELHSDACIPTGQRCPSRKPRGKKGRKLGCNACCQGTSHTDADGKRFCGCQPNGSLCTTALASACCSGYCDGTSCRAAPCSAVNSCPQCQACNPATGLCEATANGTNCDDGNPCTTGDACVDGICQSGPALLCEDGQRCVGGGCICDADSCPTGCCASGECHIDDDDACGTSGGSCTPCTGIDVTCGGGGTPGVCACTPMPDALTCQGLCGGVTNNCGQEVDCTEVCVMAGNLCINDNTICVPRCPLTGIPSPWYRLRKGLLPLTRI
jgi:hypothetical protein